MTRRLSAEPPRTPSPSGEGLLQHRGWVRSVARSMVGDGPLADDVEQETWLVALRVDPAQVTTPRAWLAGVVRNVVRGLRRTEHRRRRRELARPGRESSPSAAELAAACEARAALRDALDALPVQQREVLLLRHVEGLPPRRIAARLDVPVRTVHSRLRRARQALRGRLHARGERSAVWAWMSLCAEGGCRSTPISTTGGLLMAAKGKSVAWGLVLLLLLLGGTAAVVVGVSDGEREVESGVAGVPDDAASDDRSSRRRGERRVQPSVASSADSQSTDRTSGGRTRAPELSGSTASAPVVVPAVEVAAELTVKIVDTDGNAVPGAKVEVHERTPRSGPDDYASMLLRISQVSEPAQSVVTDADGRVTLDRPSDDGVERVVRVARDGAADIVIRMPAIGGDLDLVLREPHRLTGRLDDLHGAPLARTRVLLTHARSSTTPFAEAVTDHGGSFAFAELPQGEHTVWFVADEGMPVPGGTVTVPSQEPVTFSVAAGGTIEGVVRDEVTGGPLADVRVIALGPDGYRGAAYSDSEGRYSMRLLGRGPVRRLFASKDGYAELHHRDGALDPAAGITEQRDFDLYRGGELVGYVRTDEGPVAGAVVQIWVRDESGYFSHHRATADDDGHYVIRGVRPGPGIVKAMKPGHRQPGFPPHRSMYQAVADGETPESCAATVVEGTSTRRDLLLELIPQSE